MPANAIDLTTLRAVQDWLNIKSPTAAQQGILQALITAASNLFLNLTGTETSDGSNPSQSPFVQAVTYNENYDGSGTERQMVRHYPIISVQQLTIGAIVVPASTSPNTYGYVIDSTGRSLSLRGAGAGYAPGFGFSFGALAQLRGGGGRGFVSGIQNVNLQYTAGYPYQPVTNELQTIPIAPGPYSFQVNLNWKADVSVNYFVGGDVLSPVTIFPAQGQYCVLDGGVYLFNSADAGKQVQVNYSAAGTPYDVEIAVRQIIALNYKRIGWIGQVSQAMSNGAGTISFTQLELPPEVQSTVANYRRVSFV